VKRLPFAAHVVSYGVEGEHMEAVIRPRVKICCISSAEEASLAVRYGASALGLVSTMPSGPGVIPDNLISEIAATVPPGVATFLLTSAQDADTIIAQQRHAGVNTLQICDRLTGGSYEDIRAALPGIKLVQVVHVTGPEALDEARLLAPQVDAILLDSGDQSLAVKELGGTGRIHDWTVSRAIRAAIDIPLYLAGGLNAGNVAEAIDAVGPFALDVCSGVRIDGWIDEAKLVAFMRAAGVLGQDARV
jgi:phosphoribosylanthranilate isomerase